MGTGGALNCPNNILSVRIKKPIGEAELGRIIQAAGLELVEVHPTKRIALAPDNSLPDWVTPKNQQLLLHLVSAAREYYAAVERRNNNDLKKEIHEIGKIVAHSRSLADLLRANIEREWTEHGEAELIEHLARLDRRLPWIQEELMAKLKYGLDWVEEVDLGLPQGALSERFKGASPFEWLVGHFLPEVFYVCFGRKATLRRPLPDEVPDGPFVKFADQVLRELSITIAGKPYERESIAKALTGALRRNRKK
jgi:hypothetical protein